MNTETLVKPSRSSLDSNMRYKLYKQFLYAADLNIKCSMLPKKLLLCKLGGVILQKLSYDFLFNQHLALSLFRLYQVTISCKK